MGALDDAAGKVAARQHARRETTTPESVLTRRATGQAAGALSPPETTPRATTTHRAMSANNAPDLVSSASTKSGGGGGGNIGGWLRRRLSEDAGEDAAADAGGVRFDLPPTPTTSATTTSVVSNATTTPSTPFAHHAAGDGGLTQANNEALFRVGLFNAVGNAILLLGVGLVVLMWRLLADFRSPMLWALLVSLALRDVKVALASRLRRTLAENTLLGLATSVVVAPARAALRAMDAATARHLNETASGGLAGGTRGARAPASAPASPLSRRAAAARATKRATARAPSSASTFHFKWLATVGVSLEVWKLASRDWALTASIAALAAVAFVAAAAAVAIASSTRRCIAPGPERADGSSSVLRDGSSSSKTTPTPRRAISSHKKTRTSGRVFRAYLAADAKIRRALIASVNPIVAASLIAVGVFLLAVVATFFTVNIARESGDAVVEAHRSMVHGYSSASGGGGGGVYARYSSPAVRGVVDAGVKAWSEAVEKQWPRALTYAQAHLEDVFPGCNVTELWESMQGMYAELMESGGEEGGLNGNGNGKRRGGRRGGGGAMMSRGGASSSRWAAGLKEAGRVLRGGDVAGAFSHLVDVGAEIAAGAGGGAKGAGGARGGGGGGGGGVRRLFGFSGGGGGKKRGGKAAGAGAASASVDDVLRVASAARNALQDRAADIVAGGGRGIAQVTSWAARASFSVFGVAGGVLSYVLKSVVFFTVLFHILNSEADPAVRLVELIPVNAHVKEVAVKSLTRGVRGVFVSCVKLALFHAAFTWVTFRAFGVHFVYTSTLASGLTAILPLLASWSVSLPAALGLLAKGEGAKAAALVLMHWITLIFVDIDIYQSEIRVVHPYVVGLSVVGGMCVFDPALQGAVLGPLLVTACATGYNLYQELMRAPVSAASGLGAATPGIGMPGTGMPGTVGGTVGPAARAAARRDASERSGAASAAAAAVARALRESPRPGSGGKRSPGARALPRVATLGRRA